MVLNAAAIKRMPDQRSHLEGSSRLGDPSRFSRTSGLFRGGVLAAELIISGIGGRTAECLQQAGPGHRGRAQWPPRSNSLQETMFVKSRSANLRIGRKSLAKLAEADRHVGGFGICVVAVLRVTPRRQADVLLNQ